MVYDLLWNYVFYYIFFIVVWIFDHIDFYFFISRDILLFLHFDNLLIIIGLSLIAIERVKGILIMVMLVVWFIIIWRLDCGLLYLIRRMQCYCNRVIWTYLWYILCIGAELSCGGSKLRFSVGFKFVVSRDGIELSVKRVIYLCKFLLSKTWRVQLPRYYREANHLTDYFTNFVVSADAICNSPSKKTLNSLC